MKDIRYIIIDNMLLFALIALGAGIIVAGRNPPHTEMYLPLGAAFIIAAGVGIYMMLATRQVAKNLYKQFDDQNKTLKENHTEITSSLKEMDTSLKETSSSLKEMATSLKEMATSQKETSSSLKEMATSQKETSSSLKEMADILKRIETKL